MVRIKIGDSLFLLERKRKGRTRTNKREEILFLHLTAPHRKVKLLAVSLFQSAMAAVLNFCEAKGSMALSLSLVLCVDYGLPLGRMGPTEDEWQLPSITKFAMIGVWSGVGGGESISPSIVRPQTRSPKSHSNHS